MKRRSNLLSFAWRGGFGGWLLILLAVPPVSAGGADLTLREGRPYCEAYKCDQLLPQAETFRVSTRAAVPILEALKGGKVFAYLFLSTDLVNIPAYSGKPLVTLIAIDPKGVILDAKVVHHNEPILLVGIPESVLNQALAQYINRSILDHFEIVSGEFGEHEQAPGREGKREEHREGKRGEGEREEHREGKRGEGEREAHREGKRGEGEREAHRDGERERESDGKARHEAEGKHDESPHDGEAVPVHMITGATVTALVLEETLLSSAQEVGQALGLIEKEARGKVTWKADYVPRSWQELVAEGSVAHLRVEAAEMQQGGGEGKPWIDMYYGDLAPAVVGRNILGEAGYEWLKDNMPQGQRAIFIVANGISSFKGSGFVRGGIFDRFHIRQGFNKFSFRDLDYENLYGIMAAGAPRFKESGIFFLRDKRLDPTKPWQFEYLASYLTGETARSKVFKSFTSTYHLPAKYYDVVMPAPQRKRESLLVRIWRDRLPEAILLTVLLAASMGVLLLRKTITAGPKRLEWVHITALTTSVVVIGLILKAPPSVTQLYPFVRYFQEDFRFNLFLSDPLLFVFWIFIAVSLLVWGRGWFCGWICPYGAMLDLIYRGSRRVLPNSWLYEFPERIHHLLRRLRYVILAALILLSLASLEWAERLAEIEPFKTTWIVGVFNREWYLTVYWWALLVISAFNFRFFCRYVCPLGAALSLGSIAQLIRIKRKEFCTRCKICTRGCEPRAIDSAGRVNRYECLLCLECEQKFYDDGVCPPLIVARREAAKLTGGAAEPTLPLQIAARRPATSN